MGQLNNLDSELGRDQEYSAAENKTLNEDIAHLSNMLHGKDEKIAALTDDLNKMQDDFNRLAPE